MQIGAAEVGFPQVGADEVSFQQVGAREVCAGEVGAAEVGAVDLGFPVAKAAEVGNLEVGAGGSLLAARAVVEIRSPPATNADNMNRMLLLSDFIGCSIYPFF